MITALLIPILGHVFLLPQAKTDDAEAKKKIQFAAILGKVASEEHVSMLADVNLAGPTPLPFAKLKGPTRLLCVARAINRSWRNLDHTQLLVRSAADAYGASRKDAIATLRWLQGLDDGMVSKLATGFFSDRDISPASRNEVLAALTPDPALLETILDPNRKTRIGMSFTVSFDVPLGDGKVQTYSVPIPFEPSTQEPAAVSAETAAPEVPLEASHGPIKFPKGEILTLQEILDRIRPHLETSISLDLRIAKTTYFIQGEFESEPFIRALRQVAHIPDLALESDPVENVDALLQSLLSRIALDKLGAVHLAKVLGDDVLKKGGMVSAAKLAEVSTFAAKVLDRYEVRGDVKIRPTLAFKVDPGGKHGVISNGFIYLIR